MPQRVFIAGEHGQMAQALARAYNLRGDYVALAGRSTISVTDERHLLSAVIAFEPDLVVNAAAYTAVDKAEDDKEAAFAINRDGAGFVAAAAEAPAYPHPSID